MVWTLSTYARRLIKGLALSLAVVFTTTTIAWSAPALPEVRSINPFQKEKSVSSLIESLEIPAHLGSLDSVDESKPEAPTLLHIQDAHANYSAQKKIQQILEHLTERYGFDLLFLEGGSGLLDPERLQLFENSEINNQVWDALAQKGEVGGAELFLLNTDQLVQAYGIEEADLYWENFTDFRQVLSERKANESFLNQINLSLSAIGSRQSNRQLKSFIKEWLMYQDSQSDVLRHLETLHQSAKTALHLDLSDTKLQRQWPNLVRYFKLQSHAKDFDLKQAKKELKHLTVILEEGGVENSWVVGLQVFLEQGSDDKDSQKEPRRFLERFYERVKPLGFQFQDYPALSLILATVTLQEEVQAEGLFREIESLSESILSHLAKTEKEKSWVELYQRWLSLKGLFRLELTREKLQKILSDPEPFRPSVLIDDMHHLSARHTSISLQQGWDQTFKQAILFYQHALKRDQAMVTEAIQQMKDLKKDRAVIITGLFFKSKRNSGFPVP